MRPDEKLKLELLQNAKDQFGCTKTAFQLLFIKLIFSVSALLPQQLRDVQVFSC